MQCNTLLVDAELLCLKNDAVERRGSVAPRFGAWIKLLRKFAHTDQQPLAERAQIPVGQVRAIEHGENVGIAYIQAVISALHGIAAEHEEFVKLKRALDHEAFRDMVSDAKDQAALRRKVRIETAGESSAPTKKSRRAG